jgi:predicted flap endonuclease-1-like 5' DNA nuclease
MNNEDFTQNLKRMGKKAHVVAGLVRQVEDFAAYLGGPPGSAAPADIEAYAAHLDEEKSGQARKKVRGLILFYRFMERPDLAETAAKIRERGVAAGRRAFLLKDFLGVDPDAVAVLRSQGIRTTAEMLAAAQTAGGRRQLAEKTGLPIEQILELARLSDLARIPGVKGVRARLYHDAGLDTVAKIAASNQEDILQITSEFVRRDNFPGIAPLPAEVRFTIEKARRLPVLIEE